MFIDTALQTSRRPQKLDDIQTRDIIYIQDDVASPDDGPKEPMSTEVLLEEELNVDLLEEIEETVGNEVRIQINKVFGLDI